ncbi:hypothetical protein AAVH_17599, partial [Aphelenchoides avenae]
MPVEESTPCLALIDIAEVSKPVYHSNEDGDKYGFVIPAFHPPSEIKIRNRL